jgi:hypothetical protein
MTLASWVIPGVGRVHAQVVALGDSMSQSIGATSIAGGWVGQLQAELAAAGSPPRIVNLSVTGARVRDVLDDQLPRLHAIGIEPDLVTLLIEPTTCWFAAVGSPPYQHVRGCSTSSRPGARSSAHCRVATARPSPSTR